MPRHLDPRVRQNNEAHLKLALRRLTLSLLNLRKEAKEAEKEIGANLNQPERSGSNNALHSSEESAEEAINAIMSIRLTMKSDRSCRTRDS